MVGLIELGKYQPLMGMPGKALMNEMTEWPRGSQIDPRSSVWRIGIYRLSFCTQSIWCEENYNALPLLRVF